MSFILKYPNGTTCDLSSDIENNSLRINGRCDEAFASGSCRAITSLLSQNIPPYTVCEIDGEQWLCSSECTKYQNTANLYVHNIQLLEITAILECFILGTKVLSTGTDKAKFQKVLDLINDKYNVSVFLVAGLQTLLESQLNDYVFGSGTTLFEVATQMLTRLNCRPKVFLITYDPNDNYKMNISIESINLINNGSAYNLDWNRITQHTLNQTNENYSKFLETEANNVVDRNNLTYDKFLTERTDETRLTQDNGKLYATSKIESVSKFEINAVASLEIRNLSGYTNFSNYIQTITSSHDVIYSDFRSLLNGETLLVWLQEIASSLNQYYQDTTLYQKLAQHCQTVGIDIDIVLNTSYEANSGTQYTFTQNGIEITDWKYNLFPVGTSQLPINIFNCTPIDITSHIVEKAEYEAMEYCIQPAYCYYTKGSNVIDGMHVIRNDDLWNAIANAIGGGYTGPMLDEALRDVNVSNSSVQTDYTDTTTNLTTNIGSSIAARSGLYNISYVPINNPRMIQEKVDTPANETAYKSFTRTYQVSSSQIDYDRLTTSMEQYCDMLGKQELTVEYDITGLASIPTLAQQISVLNVNFYLMSYEIVNHTTHKVMTLNLCKSYYKVADAIGVAYQYNATRLPVEGIVERPVYVLVDDISNISSVISNNDIYLRLTFDPNGVAPRTIITRASLMINGNKRVLYCEAEDQFSFGRKIENYTSNNLTYEVIEYVPYGDTNNEVETLTAQVITINEEITYAKSRKFPDGTAITDYSVIGQKTIVLHKDAREKLTFTIEIKEE